ncbi:MAG: hypothetical protein P8P74_11095 [Crocinitomicaceae bacterium]|nr:hypothetical protein [Crocinitomicaceae bacterium]
MIRSVFFLLIWLLVSSCGNLNNSNFSKRKHLKGHFWNLKKKYKNSSSTNDDEVYSVSQESSNTESKEKETVVAELETKHETEREEPTIIRTEQEVKPESTDDLSSQEPLSPASHQQQVDETNSEEQLKERPSQSELNFAAFIIILVGLLFWTGVIGLIVSLILHLTGKFIPWLFYYSLFAAGIPFLAFIIIILLFVVFDI